MKGFIALLFSIRSFCILSLKPNICINCKFFKKELFDDPKYGECTFFQYEENNIDNLVTGETTKQKIQYYYCSTARTYSNMCGEEGKYYVSKK